MVEFLIFLMVIGGCMVMYGMRSKIKRFFHSVDKMSIFSILVCLVVVFMVLVIFIMVSPIPEGDTKIIEGYIINVDYAGGYGWSKTTVTFNNSVIQFRGTPAIRSNVYARIYYKDSMFDKDCIFERVEYE